jgi:mRNA-degrading endonuclease toxin of MazEF toxin-antitoxin module
MSYVCPNGHSVSSSVAMRCPGHGCRALVTYEPMARGVELHEENERLKQAGAALADAVRALDSYAMLGGAPMERTERADAALNAWARVA